MIKEIYSEKKIKLKILESVKEYVKVNGWNSDIFDYINIKNLKKSEILTYFPNGIYDILNFTYDELNNKLKNSLKRINIINLPINKRIKKILITRIELMNKDKNFYKKTFYFLALNNNKNVVKKNLYKTVDEMWYLAGDNSTDFNFYTKRLVLAGLYVNAIAVFFNKNILEAEKNIDRNLKRISKIPKIKNRLTFFKDNILIVLKSIIN